MRTVVKDDSPTSEIELYGFPAEKPEAQWVSRRLGKGWAVGLTTDLQYYKNGFLYIYVFS